MVENNRATGRTFRTLLRAIITASESKQGQMVAVIAANDNYAFDLQRHSAGIIGSYLHSDAYIFNSRLRTIEIVGAAVLKFTTEKHLDQNPQERKYISSFIFDHYTGKPC